MKKLLLLAAIGLISSVASAQSGYAGASIGTGYVLGFTGFPLTAQVGLEVAPAFDIRTDVSMYITGTGLQLGANALGKFNNGEIIGYGGGGTRLLVNMGSGGGMLLGLGGLGGAEYMLDDQVGLFGEGGVDVFLPVGIPVIKVVSGVNFHF